MVSKIVLVDSKKDFSKYFLKFSSGSEGIGSIGKSWNNLWYIDVPGLHNIQSKRFKDKTTAIRALKSHVRKN